MHKSYIIQKEILGNRYFLKKNELGRYEWTGLMENALKFSSTDKVIEVMNIQKKVYNEPISYLETKTIL